MNAPVRPVGEWLPLTSAQQGLLFAHLRRPDQPTYTTAEVVELAGDLDVGRLADAVRSVHDGHEQLRTRFRVTPQGPQQQVIDVVHPFEVVDLRESPDPEAAARDWCAAALARPMDVERGDVVRAAVLRTGADRWWFWHAAHHLVLDGFGVVHLLRAVATACAEGTRVVPSGVGVAELVAEDLRVQDAERAAGADTFWDRRLADADDVVALAGRSADPGPRALRVSSEVGADLQQRLVAGASRLGVTWADLVQAATGAYLARCAGTARVRIGVPLMNRTRGGEGTLLAARTVCTAVNVLPATVEVQDRSWGELLERWQQEALALRSHPFTRQETLARVVSSHGGGQLFGAQVNLVPFALELDFGTARGAVRNQSAGPVEDLTLTLRGVPGRGRTVRVEVDANPELYDAELLERHLVRLQNWWGTCADADPATGVEDLPLLDHAERAQVLVAFNDTWLPSSPSTLAARFEEQRARTPDAVAVLDGDRELSYAGFGAEVDRLARALCAAGARTGDVVGVMVPRSVDLYVALHAVQRIGAVHLPLDADLPEARVRSMLTDADCGVVVVPDDPERATVTRVLRGRMMVPVGSAAPLTALPPLPVDTTAGAYVLFTSGSTGRPKGVLVDQAAIDNRLAWMQQQFPIGTGDRVLHKTPVTFDVSVWEHFWPLQVGACVVVAAPGVHRDPRALADLVAEERVHVLHFVPAMLRAFLADPVARGRVQGAGVRHVVCSGEALAADLVEECTRWFGVAPVNLYGPTEAAVDVTVFDTADLTGPTVPIGRPVPNTRCYVLDRAGNPVPVGTPGTLWVAGVQVAVGYLARPEETARRFRPDPWVRGERMYDTGDLARWQPDGTLVYLGRGDDQVKVRGQRVELGEVEAALSPTEGVDAVVAGVVGSHLVAWYRPTTDHPAHDVRAALLERARTTLFDGARPTRWIAVDRIPVSTSGKADRAALAATHPVPDQPQDALDAPADLLTEQVCAVVSRVLGAGPVSPGTDFFAAGGDSLAALRLLGELEATFTTTLSVRDVFAAPTPSGLAAAVRAARDPHDDGGREDLAEVVVLRPGVPTRPPLVLLPPAGGLGWCYTGLLPYLPPEQGVLVVQAPGIEQGEPEPVADLAALAHRQLRAVRRVVGRAPFHVAGWSLGGMAAHEVAALARSEGQDVGAVLLLDAYPASAWQHLPVPTVSEALRGVLRMAGLEHVAGPDEVLDHDRVRTLLRSQGSALAALPDAVLSGSLASIVEAARLVRTSSHRTLPGDVDVVVATAPRPETWLDADAWQAHTDGEVRQHHLPVGHGDLVRPVAVARVGALASELVERAYRDLCPAALPTAPVPVR